MAGIKVFGHPASTATRRVLIALQEKDLDFELVHVELKDGEHKKQPFLSRNPFGKVPAFEDGDFKLFESRAITQYIAHEYADKGNQLLSPGSKNMAILAMGMEIEAHEFDSVASKLGWEQIFENFFGLTTDPAVVKEEEARLGGEDIGDSFRRDLKLISEVRAPFRGFRKFFYFAFSAAAGISTLFTIPRLIQAVRGGDGAPDLLGNAAINIGGIVVLLALFIWENKKEEEQMVQITRDETLSRLPLRLSTNRVVELVQLRDTVRPVILAGKKETVALAMQKADRFRTELLRRGVLLVPVVWGERKTPEVEKKRGFGASSKTAATSLPSIGEDFDTRTQSVVAQSKLKSEIRFKSEVVSPGEWERWIRDQQIAEGVVPGEDVYIILRLDGRVRRSGKGMPDWAEISKELPPMNDVLSKLER
ncbi:hypothetical protein DY000_02051778 [Brassica cretica]|uniref:GST N-terminal domain-containing protein n=1 Tax=Brassica cretica TaxID=69181 RepID=A0ABQ7AD16_BRACR|nr:hypothetical protein DY000_02051778 [Brassica cretica]